VDHELREMLLDPKSAPTGRVRVPRRVRDRVRDWLPYVMFLAWVFLQIWQGTGWLHAREATELDTAKEVAALREEVRKVPDIYMRRDVFTEVLVRINERLTSIDNKLAGDRR
jgi:hypothetical protein